MARTPRKQKAEAPRKERAPRQDPLKGFREPEEEIDEEELILPASLGELNVLDMAFEMRAALKHVDGPLRYVLEQARDEARQALRDLLKCDPFDGEKIRKFQWEWQRFDRLMQWVYQTLLAGKFIEQEKTAAEMDEIRQLLHDAGQGD